ncbi:zinc finger CCCH-type with G patch domain-containing protein [Uranotaenia lowii]|uniref:zinc finger CCCH-type with G patch domain-containing protein n=1 Tax=Uranotaenia lowii TaxID=190385 RepID=UPI002479899A|nr:zinc finger CCCH-type with G patch domain-containing protein [Uranotaenia lowii]
MANIQELNDSINLYKAQLEQVDCTLATTTSESERNELENLRRDLAELLQLTLETLKHQTEAIPKADNSTEFSAEDPNNDEYASFMAEISALDAPVTGKPCQTASTLDGTDDVNKETNSNLEDTFQQLVGSKCSAPHVHKWGSKMYHNAMICSFDSTDVTNVTVKILFINPTHQEMIPCSYYLEGECKFDDDRCRYSHGENVTFDELKDYHEPNFELLKKKHPKVLVKQKNKLWSKGTVKEADFKNKTCEILLEEGKKAVEAPFENIFPLKDQEETDDSSDNGSENEDDDLTAMRNAHIIQQSLLNPVPSQRLGEWEKHTRGIGSKIMQKMGYVVGAGLGSRGEGRVVPVCAQVLPQGKSLDYCMQLREKSNGNSDLFSVEKKLLREQRIQERRNANFARRNNNKSDVFSFINTQILGGGEEASKSVGSSSSKKNNLDIPSCSSKNLNVASLVLGEQTKRLELDIVKLSQSLSRHQPGSVMHTNLNKQISAKRNEIRQIQETEVSISREQQLRSDKKKMTVF